MPQQRNKREASNERHLEKMLAWHFARIGLLGFIRSQRVSVWWNGEDRNNKLSIAFRDFILSLIDGRYDDAERHRKEIADNCTPWLLCCKNFMRLAYVEYAYFCEATGRGIEDSATILTALGISKRKSKSFFNDMHKRLCKSKIVAETYSAFQEFMDAEASYYALPIRNCAVCATMGAGKSTFINALLGCDVLPARNEATTAKITSVYDRDGQKQMSGFFQGEKGSIGGLCDDVTLKVLDGWNNNRELSHLFLCGDLDGIRNKGMVVAVHDTPGTNNSSDHTHHHMTMKFLADNLIDLILFVLNAEHIGTTDERTLLREVYRNVVRKYNPSVLFILNKKDSIDPDKEDIDKMVVETRRQLEEIGYVNPTILPVASKSARLLKMSAKGLESRLTSKERRELALLLADATDTNVLLNATGLPNIEQFIEEIFTTEGGKQ